MYLKFRFTPKIVNDYHCSIYIYVLNSLTLVSVWLMVAVSLERLLVIKFALQTKYMIKLRAILLLVFIFFTIFCLNVFDLAPGLYIKPQWYANLTLFCERDDIKGTENNSAIRNIKSLGPIQFDTTMFALIRTLFQTVVPFLMVLIFNSLIIYNFKQIKTAAFSHSGISHPTTGKSNSCVSVASAGSYASANYLQQRENVNKKQEQNGRMRRSTKLTSRSIQNNSSVSPCHQLQIPATTRPTTYRINNQSSSRSPSPLNMISIPATPTSLVSALNLAERNIFTRFFN